MPEDPRDANQRPGAQIQGQQPQYHAYGWSPPDEEISLFDIWDALVRRKWLIVGVAALVTLIALAHALTKPAVYRYQQVLEIGTRMDGEEVLPLESPKSVAATLNLQHIPVAVRDWVNDHPETKWQPALEASVPRDSETVIIEMKAESNRAKAVSTIINAATAPVLADHGRITEAVRREIDAQLIQMRNRLQGHQDEIKQLQAQRARLERREALIESEIADVEGLLKETENNHRRVNQEVDGATQAMTLLMLSNEVRETRRRLGNLRDRLLVDLPNQRDGIRSSIANEERSIEETKSRIDALQARMDTLARTRAQSDALRSRNPVGASGKVILAVGVVLGGMLGVFAAFIAEFAAAARRRKIGGGEPDNSG